MKDADIQLIESIQPREDGIHVSFWVLVNGGTRYHRSRCFPAGTAMDTIREYLKPQHEDAVGFMMIEAG